MENTVVYWTPQKLINFKKTVKFKRICKMKCQILVLNIILLLVGLLSSTSSSFLNSVSDEELLESLRNEQYILVLFSK